ncbi:hypothetical protein RIF29_31858 [Crotalaria pallida]|uniref:Nuclear/nucleolar GTPase 2 n=1 Tax=Crotalaria pallida TaxID=3830 RepID=A0AAN9I239_CROPI
MPSVRVNRSNGLRTRSAATVRRLRMYNTRPVRDRNGNILRHEFQSNELPSTQIQPDRRWFGNTRVVNQRDLELFREELQSRISSNYTRVVNQRGPELSQEERMSSNHSVILKEKKLPLSLLNDHQKMHLAADYASLVQKADGSHEAFEQRYACSVSLEANEGDGFRDLVRHTMFEKGQSNRIWGELYKVIDSSDVIVQVLDARDPIGTRCYHLEKHLKKKCKHKYMVLLLNKCDLVPAWAIKGWCRVLAKEYPTVAFHASINNSYGKDSLLSVLRQFARLKSDKQAISVGFVGYPNVGKSSVINTLRTKNVCKVAPIPGETKVWQYITLSKRIFLVDCPGVVEHNNDSETDVVLKGVVGYSTCAALTDTFAMSSHVRVTNLQDAADHIGEVLKRVKKEHLKRAYKIEEWVDDKDFLVQLCKSSGKLLRGGEPDMMTAAKMVLHDWQRGRIPYFVPPPHHHASSKEPNLNGGLDIDDDDDAVDSNQTSAVDTLLSSKLLPSSDS